MNGSWDFRDMLEPLSTGKKWKIKAQPQEPKNLQEDTTYRTERILSVETGYWIDSSSCIKNWRKDELL